MQSRRGLERCAETWSQVRLCLTEGERPGADRAAVAREISVLLNELLDELSGGPASDCMAVSREVAVELARLSPTVGWDVVRELIERAMALLRMGHLGVHAGALQTEVFALRADAARLAPGGQRARRRPSSGLRVLILDDSRLIRELLVDALAEEGFEPRAVGSFAEFSQVAASFAPHMIVSDVNLPDGQGDDLCRSIKDRVTGQVPVVLMSSIPADEWAHRARDADADLYVSKSQGPQAVAELVQALSDLIVF